MYENIRVPPSGCRIIRLSTITLINCLIYWLSSVVGLGLGRCRKVLFSLFVKNNLLTILCTRAGAGGGGGVGLGRQHLKFVVFFSSVAVSFLFCFCKLSVRNKVLRNRGRPTYVAPTP